MARTPIGQVPVGLFTVTASQCSGAQRLLGQNQGTIASDGSTVTANIQLVANVDPAAIHDV